jgi:hypothetical protein
MSVLKSAGDIDQRRWWWSSLDLQLVRRMFQGSKGTLRMSSIRSVNKRGESMVHTLPHGYSCRQPIRLISACGSLGLCLPRAAEVDVEDELLRLKERVWVASSRIPRSAG